MTHLLSSLIAGLLFLTFFLPNSGAGVMAAPPSSAHAATTTHVVAAGDTLYSIATRYGTTVAALKAANGLTSDLIWVGQTLQVETSSSTPASSTPSSLTPASTTPTSSTPTSSTPASSTPATGTYHTVVQGDTLYSIARRYGTTVDAIMQANGLTSPNIYIGQRLIISSSSVPPTASVSPTAGTNYTVVQGDTLYSLARRYGTTVEAIMVANALPSTHIYVGQQLLIPSTQTPVAQTIGTPTTGTPTTGTPTAGTATPTLTPTGTRSVTGTPTPTPTSTVPQSQSQTPTQTPTQTAIPTVPTPTKTVTPSPTAISTPTQAEISYVERVVELSNLMADSMTFIGAQLIALSNNPALLNDPEWVVTTFATVETMQGYLDEIRALAIPQRYLAAGNELISAVNLFDQALDALTLGLTNKDLSQINLFTQLVKDALAALNRAKAALPT